MFQEMETTGEQGERRDSGRKITGDRSKMMIREGQAADKSSIPLKEARVTEEIL